jgi:glycerate kinase
MKIVVAPDKFKGTFTAAQITAAIAAGIRDAIPDAEIILKPMADGGEGTLAALTSIARAQWAETPVPRYSNGPGRTHQGAALRSSSEPASPDAGSRLITRRVTGPLPEMQVDAKFALFDDNTAVIESAAASGLCLLSPEDRNPLATTTFGTGQLIAAAVEAGARKIILALGGSATVDGGLGALQACGFSILTTDGEPLSPTDPLCGRDIGRVLTVKHGRGEITGGIEVIAACDVMVPLLGPTGSARMFAPQKGADAAAVEQLERDLSALVARSGTKAAADTPGAAAAGGLGFAVAAFFRGRLRRGFDVVAEAVDLAAALDGATACITGEGRLDAQSAHGKVVGSVATICSARGIPCFAIVGSAEPGVAIGGLTEVFGLTTGTDLQAVADRTKAAALAIAGQ